LGVEAVTMPDVLKLEDFRRLRVNFGCWRKGVLEGERDEVVEVVIVVIFP
jgi:hypothetical protein